MRFSEDFPLLVQRARFAGLALGTAVLGLASRRYAAALPGWVLAYAGDVLWALLVFWLVSTVWPQRRGRWRATVAGALALAVELSQLCQVPWLVELRRHRLGGLLLGHGFRWSDLVCYAGGILLGWASSQLMNLLWERKSTDVGRSGKA